MSALPASGPRSDSQSESMIACFAVHAPTDPSLMPRVIDIFARRGLVPLSWHSILCGMDGEETQIDLQIGGVDRSMAGRLAEELRRLVGVAKVLTSEKNTVAVPLRLSA